MTGYVCDCMSLSGLPATLETQGKTLKMSFQFFSRGKLREFRKNNKNQGKLGEFVTVTQKGKVFASLGYVRLVPCVQVVFIN